MVRCCVLDGIPIWSVDSGWLIYWVAASGQTRDEAIRRGWWWALGGCAGSVLICSRLRMGVMERRVLVDGWRAWRWTCEQELQVLWLVSTCRWQTDVRFVLKGQSR